MLSFYFQQFSQNCLVVHNVTSIRLHCCWRYVLTFPFPLVADLHVKAGPSGCVTASRLANSPAKPSVLLLEAGSSNKGVEYTIPADRYNLAFTQPTMNWGYQTEPQTHLKGQQIDYSRGKGLGGSTAINFCCWVIGADEDFEEFARLVGDDAWAWRNVKERFKKIETYHIEIPKEHQQYIGPKATGR